MRTMRARNVVWPLLAATAVACQAPRSASPPAPPSAEEVRSFLSEVAAASADESRLRRFFEDGASYPADDFAILRSSEFWKLRPTSRVKRLGPDAFRINFLPAQAPQRQGPLTVNTRITVPVRRGRDGQLRILSRKETERLAKLPVPEDPDGEVVALDYPDEGSLGRQPGTHYATELRAAVQGDSVRLTVRFDPPLTSPDLTADRPVKEDVGLGDEIRVEIAFDADASAATGFRMDEFYRRLDEVEKGTYGRAQQVQQWQDFGVDKRLVLKGTKFVQRDGVRAWGLHAALSDEAPESAGDGAIRHNRVVVFEKTLADPEVEAEDDLLTLTVPAALLPMKVAASYRVMLQNNGGQAPRQRAQRGTVTGPSS